jgi:hypothetical protein
VHRNYLPLSLLLHTNFFVPQLATSPFDNSRPISDPRLRLLEAAKIRSGFSCFSSTSRHRKSRPVARLRPLAQPDPGSAVSPLHPPQCSVLQETVTVTSSPGIHGPGPLGEEWFHLRSNPLELSSSLRSKRLTEGYYASLALVFKSVKLPPTKHGCTVVRDDTVISEQYPSYSKLSSVWSNPLLQCPAYSVRARCPRSPDVQ